MIAALLAHQGGWDEMLLVAVPMVLFGGLLWVANRRAEAQLSSTERPDQAPLDPAEHPDR